MKSRMSDQLRQIGSYLGHLVKARTRHGVHSPFVYDLISQVLRPTITLPEFETIEALRDDLLASDQTIQVRVYSTSLFVVCPTRPRRH